MPEKHESEKNKIVSRRSFLKNTGMVTGGVVGGAVLGGLLGNPFKTETPQGDPEKKTDFHEQTPVDYSETRQFFKRKEDFDVLSMATERIFPEDEHGPGAIGLGVPYFIDKQLAGPWGINADDYMKRPFLTPELNQLPQVPLNRADIFILGVRMLNEVSKTDYGDAFYNLEEERQIEILQAFESGEVKMNKVSSAFFFGLLRQSTLEGAYSDPMYGGNKNMEGWKMKEFPGAQMSYTNVVEEEEFLLIDPVSLKGHH
ncbi:gluconate 2-dehydrogenase subunit 3 family protein [Oceanobacillus saliphilus]|uniref:gluconate 2-dehydrogenase subunit 3 family protein n=1 Tax=Oceanobacillus saliphilus TaxID=2925834 RepID=UPI00201E5873|nr:gluconate 2-dehydrogenase subunit 3 family protein [Oceanobacillus saliphilus]